NISQITGSAVSSGVIRGVTGTSVTSPTVLDRLKITTGNAATFGTSNYAVYCLSCSGLTLKNSTIVAGGGGPGAAGSPGTAGAGGATGNPGTGGGGGGGGGGQNCTFCTKGTGNGAGGGGAGGCPGTGGNAGTAGGGSFGVFIVNSSGLVMTNDIIQSGAGGV